VRLDFLYLERWSVFPTFIMANARRSSDHGGLVVPISNDELWHSSPSILLQPDLVRFVRSRGTVERCSAGCVDEAG